MDLLKKHYEKLLLIMVLLCLACLAAILPFSLKAVDQDIDQQTRNPRPVAFESESASRPVVPRTPQIDISDPSHNLFNPVGWIRDETTPGSFHKDPDYLKRGAIAFKVSEIRPLHFVIAYRELKEESGGRFTYHFDVTREADPDSRNRRRMRRRAKLGDDNDIFTLAKVLGPPSSPSGFVLQLVEGKRRIEVGASEPFREVAGYEADLFYRPSEKSPSKKSFDGKRAGDMLVVDQRRGERFKVVMVVSGEVMIRDERNQKQAVLKADG